MRIISLTEKINRDQKIIWKWISDYGNIHRIHPALTHSYIVGDKQCGVGAIRVCEMPGKNFMKEQVVEWEEGRFFTIELIETSMPMKSARATIWCFRKNHGYFSVTIYDEKNDGRHF